MTHEIIASLLDERGRHRRDCRQLRRRPGVDRRVRAGRRASRRPGARSRALGLHEPRCRSCAAPPRRRASFRRQPRARGPVRRPAGGARTAADPAAPRGAVARLRSSSPSWAPRGLSLAVCRRLVVPAKAGTQCRSGHGESLDSRLPITTLGGRLRGMTETKSPPGGGLSERLQVAGSPRSRG